MTENKDKPLRDPDGNRILHRYEVIGRDAGGHEAEYRMVAPNVGVARRRAEKVWRDKGCVIVSVRRMYEMTEPRHASRVPVG